MKKIIYLSLILMLWIVVASFFSDSKIHKVMKRDGAEPGYTGSPGDSLKNCSTCHGGTVTNVNDWVKSNIPATGYLPGESYTITVRNREIGATRFGFEASPQALNGDLQGQIVLTDTSATKLVGQNKYITYTANGVDGIDSLSWSFDWIAPTVGSGDVTFYAGFNSNYDGHKAGDRTYLSTLFVTEGVNSTPKNQKLNLNFSVYPNPTNAILNVNIEIIEKSQMSFEIIDVMGKQIYRSQENDVTTSHFKKQISTDQFPNGSYLLYANVNGKISKKKFNVVH